MPDPDSPASTHSSASPAVSASSTVQQAAHRVTMVCEDLDKAPWFAVPSGYSVRYYSPGDLETWLRIQQQSEPDHLVTAEVFERAFGGDEEALGKRQCFLRTPEGEEIGSATAWFDNDYRGQMFGRIHWVAVLPHWQSRGLSKALLAEACARLRALGHRQAYLATYTSKVVAINLYLGFGFVPEIRTQGDREAWESIPPDKLRSRLPNM